MAEKEWVLDDWSEDDFIALARKHGKPMTEELRAFLVEGEWFAGASPETVGKLRASWETKP